MARARGNLITSLAVLLLVSLSAVTAFSAAALSAEPDDGCVWTKAREDTVMGFLGVVYGDAIKEYAVDSARLMSYDGISPFCEFWLTLKNERTGAVLEVNAFWMFGEFAGFTLRLLPAEPVATLNLGNPLKDDGAALSMEAVSAIDGLIGRVLRAVNVPDLRGRDLNLSRAVRGNELVLSERPFGRQRDSPIKDFAESVRLGDDVMARIMYRWDEQGHQDVFIDYYRVYDVGLNMTTRYKLLSVSFSKPGPGQGWIVYSIHFVPYPVRFRRVEVPPDAYIEKAREAMAERLRGSCRIMNVSYQRLEYMLWPREVNGSIYFEKPAYYYFITLDCGKWVWGYTVSINAVNGKVIHVSPAGTKGAHADDVDDVGNNPAPQIIYGIGVPAAVAIIGALALLIYRNRALNRH